jgi:hypothetical protein
MILYYLTTEGCRFVIDGFYQYNKFTLMKSANTKESYYHSLTRKLYENRASDNYSIFIVRQRARKDANRIENSRSSLTVFALYALPEIYGRSMQEFFSDTDNQEEM